MNKEYNIREITETEPLKEDEIEISIPTRNLMYNYCKTARKKYYQSIKKGLSHKKALEIASRVNLRNNPSANNC
jgi:hypothetical protein